MSYERRIKECVTEEKLFEIWKSKEALVHQYQYEKESREVTINHNNIFISDGVVNQEVWYNNPDKKRILFILKEAYGGEKDWSLAEELSLKDPWSSIWKRVIEWTYGIQNTTASKIAKYSTSEISMSANNDYLNQIAVLNIKKSGGKSSSNMSEIMGYADANRIEIRRQIEIIDPDIIICGYTIEPLNFIYDGKIKTKNNYCDNWYYYTNEIGERERMIIDYYHPANQYPALMNYYGIVNVYQQALLYKNAGTSKMLM